jgi:MFS family permease
MNNLLHAISTWITSKKTHELLYNGGILFGLVGFGIVLLAGQEAASVALPWMYVSVLLLAAGFVVWAQPTLKRLWSSDFGKRARPLVHVGVGLMSTIFARHQVSRVLGYPPQDFDLTVYSLAFLFYIPLWVLFVSFPLFVGSAICAFFAFIAGFFVFGTGTHKEKITRFTTHSLAALVLFIAVLICASKAMSMVESNTSFAVKLVAFLADYHYAENYPGIEPGERIRLHENGVVSISSWKDGEINIRRRYFSPVDPNSNASGDAKNGK